VSKPFTMLVIDAVGGSDLPADIKLLLIAMAYLANRATGVGLSSQRTLGKFCSCSDRAVRMKLERLDAMTDAETPVRVQTRHRHRRDGRGRTSDEYQLVLTNRKPVSASATAPTGSPIPDELRQPTGSQLPAKEAPEATTNRKPIAVQPEAECTTNRKPASGHDPVRDPVSGSSEFSLQSPSAKPVRGKQPGTAKARARRVPADWEPKPDHRELAIQRGVDLDVEITKMRDHEFKDPRSDWDAAARNWLRNAHPPRAASYANQPRQPSGNFDPTRFE
jgi:hypothetical protein